MPLNVIVLEFDPILRIGEAEMRLETVALAGVLVLSLLVAAFVARAMPAGQGIGRHGSRLRADDLLFITMGALPGAVIGGRLGYVLLHLDYYAANPATIVDPAYGSLELTLGVVGGVLSAAYVLRLLGAPLGRWAHVAIFPLLLALGAGKLVQVLGGDGQGVPTDLPWGTLYAGDGPWGSLGPEIASHPSQVYEGIAVLLLLQVMTILVARGVFRLPDGTALLVGLGIWAVIRTVVAFTWRDVPLLGLIRVEQVIALGVAAGCAGLLLARRRAARRSSQPAPAPAGVEMAHPTAPEPAAADAVGQEAATEPGSPLTPGGAPAASAPSPRLTGRDAR